METNLNLLYQWGRIHEGALASGHMLRRLGNQARHMDRAIDVSEEPTIIGLLQLWIEWFICLSSPNQKHGVTEKISFSDWSHLTPLLKMLTLGDPEHFGRELTTDDAIEVLLADASIACYAGERLIDYRIPLADSFTQRAKSQFPKNRRATQIRALYFSRNGAPLEAVRSLQPLTRCPRQDSETFGILGGAYKNLWISNRDTKHLREAYQQYSEGARYFQSDYYLRINVAATALWLGERNEARAQAYEALQILRKFGFTGDRGGVSEKSTYWVVATLAEANFLAENYAIAFSLYEQTHALDTTGGRWERTVEQLRLHLEKLATPKENIRFFPIFGKNNQMD